MNCDISQSEATKPIFARIKEAIHRKWHRFPQADTIFTAHAKRTLGEISDQISACDEASRNEVVASSYQALVDRVEAIAQKRDPAPERTRLNEAIERLKGQRFSTMEGCSIEGSIRALSAQIERHENERGLMHQGLSS